MIKKDFIDTDVTPMIKWVTNINTIDPTGRINKTTGKKKEYGSQHTVPDNKIFKPLFDKINQIGIEEVGKYVISDVWTNYNPPNGVNNKHHHADSELSGCYYLYVPDSSGEIEFETGEKYLPTSKEIYWWNSKIVHWVHKNNSDKIRISIAFNIKKI
jgi:hypothetical protein